MTPPCVVPTFRPYTVENLEFGGFYASSCESRAKELVEHVAATLVCNSDRTFRCIRWPDGREALAIKVRDRIGVEVTPDHFETWDRRFECSDRRCRKLARSRVSARDA
jgi:hypothetical protein